MTQEGVARALGALASVTLVRGALLFAVAAVAATLAGRLRPEVRHLAWLAVLAGLLLIPVGWLVLPAVHVGPWIPRAPASHLGAAAAPALSRSEYLRLVERTVVDTSRALRPHPLPFAAIFAALVSTWACGALLLSARIVVGTSRMRRLAAKASRDEALETEARRLAARIGAAAPVRVLLSPRCSIPFTLGVRRPLVILPPGAPAWEPGRARAVLLHELSHVRRLDVLVHSLAYGVCIVFWFFPPAWLAYAAMLREAEAACDQTVVDSGIGAAAYARDILELVHGSRGRMLLPAMTTALAGPEMIKQRIRGVLSLRPGRRPFRRWHAAAVLAAALCCVAPALSVFGSAAGAGLAPDDPFFGTWVNEEYDSRDPPIISRAVVTADGHELDYLYIADTVPHSECWNTVEASWTEAGARWYRCRSVCWAYPSKAGKIESYSLTRISADGNTMESVWAQYGYPEKLDSLGPGYGIMYRQE